MLNVSRESSRKVSSHSFLSFLLLFIAQLVLLNNEGFAQTSTASSTPIPEQRDCTDEEFTKQCSNVGRPCSSSVVCGQTADCSTACVECKALVVGSIGAPNYTCNRIDCGTAEGENNCNKTSCDEFCDLANNPENCGKSCQPEELGTVPITCGACTKPADGGSNESPGDSGGGAAEVPLDRGHCHIGFVQINMLCILQNPVTESKRFVDAQNDCRSTFATARVATYADYQLVFDNINVVARFNPDGLWLGDALTGDNKALYGNEPITSDSDVDLLGKPEGERKRLRG